MASKLIQLEDDLYVEAEVDEKKAKEISGGSADRVESSFEKIKPILLKTCRPIAETWKELNKEMTVGQAEIELGLSFEGEGNLFITKAKTAANIRVKLILKPGNMEDGK